jgi:hypothetical protein
VSKKRATLVVYRSDRTPWSDGNLQCRVIDLFGASGPRVLLTRTVPPVVELELDLPLGGSDAYGLSLDAADHRSAWHVLTRRSFLRSDGLGEREGDTTIIRTMLVHRNARSADFAAALRALELQGSPFSLFGAQRFLALSDPAKLAFLNIEAKLRETRIGVRSLLSFVRVVREVASDRVFLFVAAELRQLVDSSPDFSDAPGHGAPSAFPGLPAHPDSWKHTRFDFGNLQLSFSKNATPLSVSGTSTHACFSVDCDIDLERDLGHAFEFIHNKVFNRQTDQTLVYRMLWDQGILPAYQLSPPEDSPAGARLSITVIGKATDLDGRQPAAGRRAGVRSRKSTVARRAGLAASRSARSRPVPAGRVGLAKSKTSRTRPAGRRKRGGQS